MSLTIGVAIVGLDARHSWSSGLPWFIGAGAVVIVALIVLFLPRRWIPWARAQNVIVGDEQERDQSRGHEPPAAVFLANIKGLIFKGNVFRGFRRPLEARNIEDAEFEDNDFGPGEQREDDPPERRDRKG